MHSADDQPFDPLAQSHADLSRIYESATPPDADGRTEEAQNLDGLLRGSVTVRSTADTEPPQRPSVYVVGGDERDPTMNVRRVDVS